MSMSSSFAPVIPSARASGAPRPASSAVATKVLRAGPFPPEPKESMQPRRRVRPPTARELDPARGDVAFAARPGYDRMLAWVRGRHDTGASLPVMQPGPRDGDPVIGDARRPRPA